MILDSQTSLIFRDFDIFCSKYLVPKYNQSVFKSVFKRAYALFLLSYYLQENEISEMHSNNICILRLHRQIDEKIFRFLLRNSIDLILKFSTKKLKLKETNAERTLDIVNEIKKCFDNFNPSFPPHFDRIYNEYKKSCKYVHSTSQSNLMLSMSIIGYDKKSGLTQNSLRCLSDILLSFNTIVYVLIYNSDNLNRMQKDHRLFIESHIDKNILTPLKNSL